MGNALNTGDGMMDAELSAIESYYSVGMTSESRASSEYNTASVATGLPLTEASGRDIGSGSLRPGTTSSKSSSRRSISSETNSRGIPNRKDRIGSRLHRGTMSSKATSRQSISSATNPHPKKHLRESERSYGVDYVESESRTDNSSAVHHGYRMRNDDRGNDERDDIEFRDDEGRYGYEHALNYRRFPDNYMSSPRYDSRIKSKSKDNSNRKYQSTDRLEKPSNKPPVSTTNSSRHRNVDPVSTRANDSSHHPRQQHQFNKVNSPRQDSNLISLDILPAETDMAYNGSEDEEEALALAFRDNEVTDSRYAVHKEEEVQLNISSPSQSTPAQPRHRDQEFRHQEFQRNQPPPVVEDASESQRQQLRSTSQDQSLLRQQEVAAHLLLEREKRASQDKTQLRQQQAAAQLLLQEDYGAVQDESLLRQQQAAAQVLLQKEELRGSQDESLRRQKQAAAQLLNGDASVAQRQQQAHHGEDTETLRSASFSTLTKTLSTMFPRMAGDDDDDDDGEEEDDDDEEEEGEEDYRPVVEKEIERTQPAEVPPPSPVPVPEPVPPVETPTAPAPVEDADEDEEEASLDQNNPAQKKLEELLVQQEVQEEILQKQLEQLRVQKERLQQLQEEKNRPTMTKPSQDDSNMEVHQQGSLHARNEELRIQKERMRAVKADPSRDGSSDYFRTTMKAARQEQTRRQRLERARQKVMPKSPKGTATTGSESMKSGSMHQRSVQKEALIQTPSVTKVTLIQTTSVQKELQNSYSPWDEKPQVDEESSTGSATGEIDESVPEYEDIPDQFRIEEPPYQENDLTTLSASLSEDFDDDSSTVSSMRDNQGLDENEQENAESLREVVSSMDEEIDLVFVAKYDKAFNAFLDTYPALFDQNSELIQNLKVAKLQKILEVSYQTECDLEAHLETPSEAKATVEIDFQKKLKEASRQKAERSIELKTELIQLKKRSKGSEAKLSWDMVLLAVNRAKKLHKIKADLNGKDLTSTHDLLASLPDTNLMREVIKAVEAKPRELSGEKQKKELQQYQVDNAFLNAEVKVLQQKIVAFAHAARKQEDLDSVLVRMDSKKLKKLKSRFQKKIAASF